MCLLLSYGQQRGLSFFKLQVPNWVGLTRQEVLICFNEPWSQGDRIHVLNFGTHVVISLAPRVRDYTFAQFGSSNDMSANMF